MIFSFSFLVDISIYKIRMIIVGKFTWYIENKEIIENSNKQRTGARAYRIDFTTVTLEKIELYC